MDLQDIIGELETIYKDNVYTHEVNLSVEQEKALLKAIKILFNKLEEDN